LIEQGFDCHDMFLLIFFPYAGCIVFADTRLECYHSASSSANSILPRLAEKASGFPYFQRCIQKRLLKSPQTGSPCAGAPVQG
ncbi:MAG: hypothetical protein IJ906_04945, partial [Oscillospiraceae bacterium]|nr:hypothetical protein [Oscillospiraceae bacterium]